MDIEGMGIVCSKELLACYKFNSVKLWDSGSVKVFLYVLGNAFKCSFKMKDIFTFC